MVPIAHTMSPFHQLCSIVLYTAFLSSLAPAQTVTAQTTVTLASSVEQAGRQAACPGEEVTFTCTATGTAGLLWIAEPHINQTVPVSFTVARNATAGETRDPTTQIHIVLDDVNSGSDPRLVNFTSTLIVRNSTALSGTVIQCSIGMITANNSLIVGTPPSSPQNARSGDVGYSTSDFTVAVQWESPASDGGVGIDSYTLTGAGITVPLTVLSSQTLMATLTLSYNEMHMVNITASNCAGESTATLVTILEVGCGLLNPPLNGSLLNLTSSQEGAVVAFGCNPGLVLSQQQRTSVCATNGNWTPDPAELVCMSPPPGDCGVPASPTNGTVAYTTTTEESLATFQCSAGLVPGEVMTAVCENSGGGARWSPDPGDLSCDVPTNCLGVLGNLSCDDAADGSCNYTASYAVQPDDSVTFTVSARTPANTWVGLGVSDDRRMTNSDIVLGAADGTNSFIHDRFAIEQAEPPIDPSQDIESASAERMDGVTTITFNRPRNSSDSNDISLDECRFFLFAYSGRVSFFTTPPGALYHGFGPTNRTASLERICIPTFTKCSAAPSTEVPTTPPSPSSTSNQAVVIAVAVVVVVAVSVAMVATVIIVYLCWRRRKSSGAFVVKTEAAADDYARVTGRGVEMDSLPKDANGFYDQPDTQKPAAERLENATDGFYSYADTRRLPPPQDKAGEASAEEYSQLQRQKAPKGVIDLSDLTYSHLQTGSGAKTERSHYADLGLSSSQVPPPVPSDAVHYSQITPQPTTAKKPPRKPINIVHPADKLLNLDTVLAQLIEVQESWYELGTGLGVPVPTLDDIRSQCSSSQECMIETIDSWIRGHAETPTWKTITAVLRQINFQSLAASIDQVYATGKLPTPFDNSVPSSSLGIPSNFGSPGGLGTPDGPPPPIPARMNTLEAAPPPKPPRDRGEHEEPPPLPARLEPEGVAPPRPPKSPLSGPPRPARRSRRRTPERNTGMPSRPPKPAPYRGDQ